MSEVKTRKRLLSIDYWSGDVSSRASLGVDGRQYKGRLIGLINDKEFAALITNKDVQKKCLTSATIPLAEIVEHHESLDGYRMVLAIKEIDDKIEIKQKLFITERLSLVSYIHSNTSAGITGEHGAYMMVEEEVEENAT